MKKELTWRISRISVATIPLVAMLIMWGHCCLLLAGIDPKLTQWVFDSSLLGYVAWIIISLSFGFCRMHRVFITYDMLTTACVDWQRSVGFG